MDRTPMTAVAARKQTFVFRNMGVYLSQEHEISNFAAEALTLCACVLRARQPRLAVIDALPLTFLQFDRILDI